MVIREVREQDRDSETEENQERAPKQRTAARVEEPGDHLTLSRVFAFSKPCRCRGIRAARCYSSALFPNLGKYVERPWKTGPGMQRRN